MSLSIFDVDRMNEREVDREVIKTFIKEITSACIMRVEVGRTLGQGNEGGRVFLQLINLCSTQGTVKINGHSSEDFNSLTLELTGECEGEAIIHALEFALSVLKEAKARVEHQEEEPF